MHKKYYTIVVFPEITGKPRNFRLSKFLFKGFIVASVLLISASVFFTHRYSVVSKEAREVTKLRTETRAQKLQIQKFVKQVQGFKKQMAHLEKFDRKLRTATALDKPEEITPNKWGIGGASEENLNDVKLSTNATAFERLSADLEQLKDQADLQEISFFQLDQFFKDRRSLLSSTPSIWPTKGWVTSGFGYRRSPYTGVREMHEGLDIAARRHSKIIAPADGIVIRSGRDYGLGVLIEIDHGYGVISRYGHNSKNLAKVGDYVKRGQIIAYVGNTGRSTGPHLHYEVLLNGIPVNPMRYIFE